MTPEEEYTYELERELEKTRAELAASRAEVARLRAAIVNLLSTGHTPDTWDNAVMLASAALVDTAHASV